MFSLPQRLSGVSTSQPAPLREFHRGQIRNPLFGLYEESTNALVYTNAGHIPSFLIRAGRALRLDVNGTVVGAFPDADYGESVVHLEPGDLLAFLTDGLTEPENQCGEMLGEDRICSRMPIEASRKSWT